MKTAVKIFRWNEVRNTSEVKVSIYDNSKKVNCADVERWRMKKALKKELVK